MMNDNISNEEAFNLDDPPIASSSPKKALDDDNLSVITPPEHSATLITSSQKKNLPPLPPHSPTKKKNALTLPKPSVCQKSPTGSGKLSPHTFSNSDNSTSNFSKSSTVDNNDDSLTNTTFLDDSLDQIELSRREIDSVVNELSSTTAHSPQIPFMDSVKKHLMVPCKNSKLPFTLRGGSEKSLMILIDSILHPDILNILHPGDMLLTIQNK